MVKIVNEALIYILSDIDNKLVMSILGYCKDVAQYFNDSDKCWVINYVAFIYNSKSNKLIITQLTYGFRKKEESKIITLDVISLKHALYESVCWVHGELVNKGYQRLAVVSNGTIIVEYDLV